MRVALYGGALASVSDMRVLDGGNVAAVLNPAGDWEILQFANAELVGERTYKLSQLLRGQAGSDFAMADPLPAGAPSINRLDHVGYTTADAEAMRAYLAGRKVKVPARVTSASDGSKWFEVTDPEGNRVQFVQPPAAPPAIATNPLSNHIIHVGFIVHNRANEDAFWKDVLGFRPYWFGGMKEDHPTWISLQVPDGTDWLEYMVVGTPDTLGIPPTLTAANLGVLNHFSLGVPNTRDAYTLLWNGERLKGQDAVPKIGRELE